MDHKKKFFSKIKEVFLSDNISRYIYIWWYKILNKAVPLRISYQIKKTNEKYYFNHKIDKIQIKTYDGSDQVVHPDVVFWRDTYWLVCTPYPYSIDSYENPSIYKGDTPYSFFAPQDCINPVALPSQIKVGNHISDPCIYDYHDKLYVIYRDTTKDCDIFYQRLYSVSSVDGSIWSDPLLIASSNTDSLISPAIITNERELYLYHIRLTTEFGGDLVFSSSMDGQSFNNESHINCSNIPTNMTIWHIAILTSHNYSKKLPANDDAYYLIGLFTLRQIGDRDKFKLFWAKSSRIGGDWEIINEFFLPSYILRNDFVYYKSAVIPHSGDVILSFHDKKIRWYFTVVKTDYLHSLNKFKSDKESSINESYRVFSNVFFSTTKFNTYRYKHFSNPYVLKKPLFLDNINNEVVGTNAFQGYIFLYKDSELIGAQSCDTAVLREYQGKGVFSRLIKKAELDFQNDRVDFMFGFPNEKSYPGFIKLGWIHVGDLMSMILVIRPFSLLLGKIFKTQFRNRHSFKHLYNFSSHLLFRHSDKNIYKYIKNYDSCPFNDSDFSKINSTQYLSVKKNLDYYTWKLDSNPAADYNYRVLKINNILYGYIIYNINQQARATIVDWYVANDNSNKSKLTILASLLYHVSLDCTYIVLPFVNPLSKENDIFKKAGFVLSTKINGKIHKSRLLAKKLVDIPRVNIYDISRWNIKYIDIDSIIK